MPYTSSEYSGSYWIDDPIPSAPNLGVQSNFYVTDTNEVISHPGWQYQNGALVSDEYLFNNKGYKLVVNTTPPVVGVGTTLYIDRKAVTSWVGIGTTSLQVEWHQYVVSYANTAPVPNFNQELKSEFTSFVTTPTEIATITYSVVGLGSTALISKIQSYRNDLGSIRQTLINLGISSATGINTNTVPSGTFTDDKYSNLTYVVDKGVVGLGSTEFLGLAATIPPFDSLFS